MKRLSVLLLMLASLPVMAQENIVDRLLQVVPDQGVISIHQDSRLEALLGVTYDPSKNKDKKIQTVGYLIQIYAEGKPRYAKGEAQKAAQ
jgi:hypothetical protein